MLPFENLSRQPGDEWLASAFSDSLTLGLRDAENIIVVSRERLLELNQSGRRSQAVDTSNVQQLSRLLDVRYYVTGTYQRVDDDLRVVARMVEAEGGAIKVQESLTDRYANLLKMEDDLARRFASALQESPAARTPVPDRVVDGVPGRRRGEHAVSGGPLSGGDSAIGERYRRGRELRRCVGAAGEELCAADRES